MKTASTTNVLIKTFILFSFYFVCFLSVCSVIAQNRKSIVVHKRDLSKYEKTKTYDFSIRKLNALDKERGEFREFLWKNWLAKRNAKVTAKFYTSEGDPTTSTFYIEPDENGQWNILVESSSICCWYYDLKNPKKKKVIRNFSETYFEIERIKELKSANGMFLGWETISGADQLPAELYKLRLKSKNTANSESIL